MQTCRQSGMMNSVFFAQQREQPSGCPEASRESACARPRAIARVERRHHSDITPDVSPYALVLSHLEFHCLSVLVFHVHPLLAEYPARLDMCCLFLCPTRPPPGGRPLSVIHEKPRPRARGRQGTIDARARGVGSQHRQTAQSVRALAGRRESALTPPAPACCPCSPSRREEEASHPDSID